MLLDTADKGALSFYLQQELREVENLFAAELLSDLACVNGLVNHVERYRGKMLRPMLVILAGLATSRPGRDGARAVGQSHRVIATVAEMVHMATLVHDDILDEAQVRRRGGTVNHLRGNETAVMLGDYLISHAYHLCSSLPSNAASRLIAGATNTVCEGELLQLANRENWRLDPGTYFEIIRRKTASLCGMCCHLGSLLSDADRETVNLLYRFGEEIGVAFQIVDDVLDLVGDESTVGKSLGKDLEKGKLTLPLIHHIHALGSDERESLVGRLAGLGPAGRGNAEFGAFMRARLEMTDSINHSRTQARDLIRSAKGCLDGLDETPAKALLLSMADAVITRDH